MARSRPGSRPCQTHFAKNENPWNSFRNGQNPNKEQCSVRNDQNPNREQAPVTLASRVATVTGACSLFRFWPFLRRQEGVCSDLYASDVRYFALLSGSFRALFALFSRLPSSCRACRALAALKFRCSNFIMQNESWKALLFNDASRTENIKIQRGTRCRPGSDPGRERVSSLDFNHVLVNEFSWYGFHTMLALKHESLKSMSCIIETQSFAWFILHYEIWASELRVLKRECQWILGFLQNVYTWSRPGSRLRLRKHEISWIFFFCSMCVAWSRPGTGPFFGNLRAEVMLPTRVSYPATHSRFQTN